MTEVFVWRDVSISMRRDLNKEEGVICLDIGI